MATFRSDFVQLVDKDVKIHVSLSVSPAPTTVVFLHYWGGSTWTWDGVASRIAYSPGRFQTVSVDFRGWGLSTGPADAAAYSIHDLANDVVDVLTQYHRGQAISDRIVLVGLSMGAKVAQVVADTLRRTETGMRLLGAVLASPAPAASMQLPPDMQEQQLRAYDNSESASFVARNVLTESFREAKELPSFLVEDMIRGNTWARAAWPAYAMAEDVTATSLSTPAGPHHEDASPHQQVASIPVLVLAAEKDIVEPLARVRAGVVEQIPGAELQVIPGSGHLSPVDDPESVYDAIIRFIEKQSASGV
ncbi:hydrolase [Ophiostoma piceae UAMH 11346]|uniref:Hydrolase n=1 Tax=Ophiostoma piceae (strain UAMH 11346) TaxID=1262450 RepID=S3D8W3_OPHP1|nr:hydrolase [Ophiostoma piceae UAMH 11346]